MIVDSLLYFHDNNLNSFQLFRFLAKISTMFCNWRVAVFSETGGPGEGGAEFR